MEYKKTKSGIPYYRCRECNTKIVRKYRATKTGRENQRKAVAKSQKKNSKKTNARARTHYYVIKGTILKADKCQECNSKETLFIHHNNYDDAFDILWLCRNCHCKKHKQPDAGH